jgi:hypothetical protein
VPGSAVHGDEESKPIARSETMDVILNAKIDRLADRLQKIEERSDEHGKLIQALALEMQALVKALQERFSP